MIEAMKQWLEALEDFVDVIKYDNEQDDIGRRACCDVLSYNPHREDCKAIKSIASLCQAIAELESQEPVAWRIKVETKLRDGSVDVGYQLRNAKMSAYDEPLYTHPLQRTEQEPVAWREVIKDLSDKYARAVVEFAKNIEKGANSMSPIAREAGDLLLALHTAIDAAPPERTKIEFYRLPQRTWVGLTDYEIGVCSTEAAMNRSEMVGGAVTFARAIEAKLKQKNGFAEEKNT
jgi:hypothetical protein